MKGILLRVGIDKGIGETLAPIFNDGSFEFIPFPEKEGKKGEKLKYSNIKGRFGGLFSDYIPKKYKDWIPHNDPEFVTPSYGDPTHKRNSLSKLSEGDLLIFHAGLKAFENTSYPSRANCIIGYFIIDRAVDFTKIENQESFKREWASLQNNFHVGYRKEKDCLVIVGKKEESMLFRKAILFTEMKPDSRGRPTVCISKKWGKILRVKGFVQRSTPRWIVEEGCKNFLNAIKKHKKEVYLNDYI